MKKISFRLRSFDKEQFLTFDIDNDAELDEELLDFLEDEEPEGIVPVIFEEQDEFDTFSYDITDKIHLCELSNQEINAEMVLMVLRGLVLSLMNMSEYRIPLSYLVLNRQYIYIDSDYKVEFVCIPLEDMKEEADLTNFFRNFIASLRFDPSENGDYVAKLLTYVNDRELFNLHNLLELVEEHMENFGIEIPDGDSNEIYGEYTEVEDAPEKADYGEDSKANDAMLDSIINEGNSDDDLEAFSGEQAGSEDAAEASYEEPVQAADETVYEEPVQAEEEPIEEPVQAEEEPMEKPVQAEEEPMEESVQAEEEPIHEEPAKADEKPVFEEQAADEAEPVLKDNDADAPDLTEAELAKPEQEETEEETAEIGGKPDDDEGGDASDEADEDETAVEQGEQKRALFRTKENTGAVGVVIEDDFEAFMAEKEKEEADTANDDQGIKIRKDVKVNRAGLLKNTQEELKAQEEELAEASSEQPEEKEEQDASDKEEQGASKKKGRTKKDKTEKADKNSKDTDKEDNGKEEGAGSILSQTIGNAANSIIGGGVPKVNPYLIRVNTDERIMIMKQTFKIGKAGMGVDYTISGNGAISRVHAIITGKDGEYFIKDNKSTNHTFVDGKNVEEGENVKLTDGCKIVLGDEEFIFKLQ